MFSKGGISIHEIKNPPEHNSRFARQFVFDQQPIQMHELLSSGADNPANIVKSSSSPRNNNNYHNFSSSGIISDPNHNSNIYLNNNNQGTPLQQSTIIIPTASVPNLIKLPSIYGLVVKSLSSKESTLKEQNFSMYIFSSKDPFRSTLSTYYNSELYLNFMRVIWILNSIALMTFDYGFRVSSNKSLSSTCIISLNLQLFCNIMGTIDVLIGLIVYGALFTPEAYLLKGWNVLSFVTVVAGWIDAFHDPLVNTFTGWLQVIYTIKALRIMKLIEKFSPLRLPFQAFLRTLSSLGQTFFPFIIFFVFYVIIGLHLFQGSTQSRCRATPSPYHGKWETVSSVSTLCGSWECPAGTYCGNLYESGMPVNSTESFSHKYTYGLVNFDNFWSSSFSVSHFMTISNWTFITFFFSHNVNKYVCAVYFVSLIVFLFYIISNLLLASLNKNFVEEEKIKDLKKKQKVAKIETKKKKLLNFNQAGKKSQDRRGSDPDLDHSKLKANKDHESFSQISNSSVSNRRMTLFSGILILVSSAVILYDYKGISDKQLTITGSMDLALTLMFLIEVTTKIWAEKGQFFNQTINLFELTILLINLIEFILCAVDGDSVIITRDPVKQLLRSTKITRLLELYYQIDFFHYQRQIIRIFFNTLRKMIAFMVMWVVIILAEAVAGMGIFGYRVRFLHETLDLVRGSPGLYHFEGIYKSIIMIMMAFVNESWMETVYILFSAVGSVAIFFYVFVVLVGHVMLLRLFIALFLEYFMKDMQKQGMLETEPDQLTSHSEHPENILASESKKAQLALKQNGKSLPNRIVPLSDKSPMDHYTFTNKPESREQESGIVLVKTQNTPVEDIEYVCGAKSPKAVDERAGQNQTQARQHEQTEVCGCFEYNNKISAACRKIHESWALEMLVYLILVALFVRMAVYPVDKAVRPRGIEILDIVIDVFLVLQVIIGIVGYGFFFGPETFLKRCWIHPVDFCVMIFGLLSWLMPFPIRALFQKFKLLKFLNYIYFDYKKGEQMKLILDSLSALGRKIFKLIILFFMMLLVVAVIPVKLVSSIAICKNAQTSDTLTQSGDCMDWGGDWVNERQSYDNPLNALLLLYEIATTESWSYYVGLHELKFNNNSWDAFYVIFFYFCNICVLGMFIGLIVEPYLHLKSKAEKLDQLTPVQKNWFLIKKSINELLPKPIIQKPQGFITSKLYSIISIKQYQICKDLLAYLNAFVLAIYVFRADPAYVKTLWIINLFCIALFCVDTLMKLIVAARTYFYLEYSYLGLIFLLYHCFYLFQKLSWTLPSHDQRVVWGISVCLQLCRCLSLFDKFLWTRMLMNAVFKIIPKCKSVVKMLFVVLVIYAAIGQYLFRYLKIQPTADGYNLGFTELYTSFMTLIKVASGERWYDQVSAGLTLLSPSSICYQIQNQLDFQKYGQQGCGTLWALPFYFSFHLICSLIIMNLLIGTMMSAYNENYEKEFCAVNVFQLGETLNYWQKYDPKGLGILPYKQFWKLSSEIAIIFGIKKDYLIVQENKQKFLQELEIPIYQNAVEGESKVLCFKFHDVITSFSKISMHMKSNNEDFEEISHPELKGRLKKQETELSQTLYKDYRRMNKLNSANMLVIMRTLKRLRNWRCLATTNQKREVNQLFDIFKIKERKDRSDRKNQIIISSNMRIPETMGLGENSMSEDECRSEVEDQSDQINDPSA